MKTIYLRLFAAIVMLFVHIAAYSQLTQTLRGKIIDQSSQVPLPGANVIILHSNPVVGTITNPNGEFVLNNIPIGRYDLGISFVGYETSVISSVFVTSGKEVVLNIELKESINKMDEVTVTSRRKDNPINSMATISARTFSVEETRRYAGGLDDPGRLASVFAGVADGNVESNGIIVRGNAPSGVIYKVEGIEVENPNHFAGEDLLGGGFVSILNSHVLANSDFLTGAFPAEYGNSLSAVFDINLRTGNTEKREHAFQVGALGLDFSSEGPFIKGKKSSYLFNYRYSTFGLVQAFLPKGEGLPVYQDLSFKFNFPTKVGTFTLWGAGGLDDYTYGDLSDKKPDQEYGDKFYINDHSGTGFAGLRHKLILNTSTYISTSVAVNGSFKSNDLKKQWTDLEYYQKERLKSNNGKYVLNWFINKKFGARHTNRTGFNYSWMFYDIKNNVSPILPQPVQQITDNSSNTGLLQAYTQSKIDISEKLSMNLGINSLYFQLNKKSSIEPRAGLRFELNNKSSISLGYGMHSQTQPLNLYFIERKEGDATVYPNKNVGFTKAQHIILGYDRRIGEHMRIKIEPFYQYLYDVPVIANSSFSILNLVDLNTFNEVLVNKGTARNIGIDLTVERFFDHGFYYLGTLSVFDSKYKGGDGVERNTRYNKNIVGNILGGKEWKVRKNNYLGVNARMYLNGGDRTTPFNQEASANAQDVIYDETRAFTIKNDFTYRCDLSITYTVNRSHLTHKFALQIMNVFGSTVGFEDKYNYSLQQSETIKGKMLLPSCSWKVEF